jgi:hypothetical protein
LPDELQIEGVERRLEAASFEAFGSEKDTRFLWAVRLAGMVGRIGWFATWPRDLPHFLELQLSKAHVAGEDSKPISKW